MKERIVYSIMALVLVLGMALTLATPVGARTVTFTGNVTIDFTGPPVVLIIPDPGGVGDVGTGNTSPPGTISGWDMVDLRLSYNESSDILYVGINFYGIGGDADGDGDPSNTATWCSDAGGNDRPDLGSTESISVYFDLDKDGEWDVIAGVPGTTNITGFTCANFTYMAGHTFIPAFNFGADLAGHKGICCGSPNATAPDFELTITNWSTLPNTLGLTDTSVGGFKVGANAGSLDDDGPGEDFITYEQNPHTITTITSSAGTVALGGTVNLTVIERNTGTVNLTNPTVVISNNITPPLITLTSPADSGDDDSDGILSVGENWTWNITSNPINAPTLFTARGNGTAPGDFPVNYITDPLEEDEVTVNTINPDICIEKTVDCDGDGNFHDEELWYAGDNATWKVVVWNCGDSDLTNVTVTDTNLYTFPAPFPLAVGQNQTFIYQTVVSMNTTNNATVTGTDALGGTVTDWDTATNNVISPDICIEKTVDCDGDGNFHDEELWYAGDNATWKVVVWNCGNSSLTNVTVTDTNLHTFPAPFPLAVGQNQTFTYQTVVSTNTTNNATVTGTDALSGTVTDWDIATNNVISPDICIEKTVDCDGDGTFHDEELWYAGDNAMWKVVVWNCGDSDLTNVTVTDTNLHTFPAPFPLAVGQNQTFTYQTVVSTNTTNNATVIGTDAIGGTVTDWDIATNNVIEPDTITTITANTTLVNIGGCVNLTVTEQNTGGVNLTNPYVEVWKIIPFPTALVANLTWVSPPPHSDDAIEPGVLNVGETWSWNTTVCGINVTTTFEARGFGTDPLGNEVSYDTHYYDERDRVTVDVTGEACLEICKFQDANVNGMWDPGEPWLPDWKFHVTGPVGYDKWWTTGDDGCVVVPDLVIGTYIVTEELKAGWYNTRPGGDPPYDQPVYVQPGVNCTRVEFGNREEIPDIPPMVPAMNKWGIIAMITLFSGLLVWTVRRKRLSSRIS